MNHIFIEFASPFLLILKGLLVGIIASAPMGPVGVLCIQRTLQKGRSYGIVTGAGAALSDIFYALMTGFGMSFVMDFIDNEQNIFWLKLIGSVMLFIFGVSQKQILFYNGKGCRANFQKILMKCFQFKVTAFLLFHLLFKVYKIQISKIIF